MDSDDENWFTLVLCDDQAFSTVPSNSGAINLNGVTAVFLNGSSTSLAISWNTGFDAIIIK